MTTAKAPAPRVRLDPAVRRRQIIVAAQRLYADRPYDRVSTAELAAAAGVARGLINHYFENKRELFLEAMRDSVMMPEVPLADLDEHSTAERTRITVEWILDAATTYGQAWVNASGVGPTTAALNAGSTRSAISRLVTGLANAWAMPHTVSASTTPANPGKAASRL